MNDRVYIFDKTTFKRELLGEIQADFNMSLVVDGTKDSISILVWSYRDFEIEPNTILWHENTNTWWCIARDKIERYENENGALYVHNIDLNSAVELFNVRDMTDCGFNDKTYTVGEFITRLINMSSFEYDFVIDTELNLSNRVDFLKTFENYSPLRALTEFLDAYNSCAKLEFATKVENNETYIDYAIFKILLKTGNSNLTSHNITDFKDTRETKSLDKNSFGTCVISNADNVVSTQAKTYPATGVVGLSANEYEMTFNNALIRLPTPVYKVNWLKFVIPVFSIAIIVREQGVGTAIIHYDNDTLSIANLRNAIQEAYDNGDITQQVYDLNINRVEEMVKQAKDCVSVTLYDGCSYNPNDTFSKPDNVPYIPKFKPTYDTGGNDLQVILCPKEVKQNMRLKQQGIAWERGSNLITGFEILSNNNIVEHRYTDGYYVPQGLHNEVVLFEDTSIFTRIEVRGAISLEFYLRENSALPPVKFIVNYIPMSNLKLKVDNQRDKKDIQIYNQNGRFSDSYALSKLLNSYSKEISSDSITRYGQYYDYESVPKVGSFVFKGNETYVINNVSLTFVQNENGYFIDCEFSMSKWVSTKSIMVNPNTNVRDYGIPQQYNVKRKQLYRDYYELDYDFYNNANQETPYLTLPNILNVGSNYQKMADYCAMIRIEYDNQVDGSFYWYYQLECFTILMQKQVVIGCDFKDNNIIGYSQNNRAFIFDVSHLFDQHSLINTPISYVDDKGKAKGIDIAFLNTEHRTDVDYAYYRLNNIDPTYDALATQVFIPEQLYNLVVASSAYDFMISEPNYNKDALEIPFFEYCCQIDDSDNVLVGDNVLNQYEGYFNFYSGVAGNNLTMNTVRDFNNIIVEDELYDGEHYLVYTLDNAIKLEYINNYEIKVTMYRQVVYSTRTKTWEYINQVSIPTDIDLAIFRHSLNVDSGSSIDEQDAMFILKKIPSAKLSDNGMSLIIKANHYKLK